MKKKLLCGLALACLIAPLTNSNHSEVREFAFDKENRTLSKTIQRGVNIGKDSTLDYSKLFVQYGSYNSYECLRFAIAVKGDISDITFTRDVLSDGTAANVKKVTTIYEGIQSGNDVVYYTTETGLTTDSFYAKDYYWACYVISFETDTYKAEEINVKVSINGEEVGTRTSSLNAAKNNSDEAQKVDIESKYQNPKQFDLIDATATMTYDQNARGYFYDAASATRSEGVNIETNSPKCIGNFGNGKYITYTINSEDTYDALVVLSATKYSSAKFNVKNMLTITYGTEEDALVHTVDAGDRTFTPLNDWNRYLQFTVGEIHLKKGINYIRLTSKDTFNYAYMGLVRPYQESLDKVEAVEFDKKYPTVAKDDLGNGVQNETMVFNNDKVGYYYEAEASLSGEGRKSDLASASGGKIVDKLTYGKTLKFEIDSAIETDVMLQTSSALYYTTNVENGLRVSFGTEENNLQIMNKYTSNRFSGNNWSSYKVYNVGEIHLSAGKNYIYLYTLLPINYDYIALISPLAEPAVDSLATYGSLEKEALINGNVTDGVASVEFDANEIGYFYEAENAKREGTNDPKTANGRTFVQNFNGSDDIMTFTINSKQNVKAGLIINLTKWNADAMDDILTASFGTDLTKMEMVNTQGRRIQNHDSWDSRFVSYNVGEVSLKQGINYIQIVGVGGGINVDYVGLVNAKKPMNSTYSYDTSTVKNNLVDGTETMSFDLENAGYFYEAEKAVLSSGIKEETNGSASGGKNIGSFQQDRTMTFTINSTVETDALMLISLTRYNDGNLIMSQAFNVKYGTADNLNYQINTYDTAIPNHGSWSAFKEYVVGEIHLVEGQNVIKFTSFKPTNVDYIALVAPNAK